MSAGSAFVLTAPPASVPDDRTLSLSTMKSYRLDGRVAGGAAGSAVGWSLDFDGRGGSEVLVGAPRVAPDASGGRFAGEAYIVPSEATGTVTLGTPAADGFVVYGEPGMSLGKSLAGLGDLSGDRLGDVAIGAPDASPGGEFKAGSALVVLSRRTPATAIAATDAPGSVIRIDGVDRYDNFGDVVAPTRLDAGSDNDLLVSAPRAGALGRIRAGAIYALLGSRIAADAIDLAQLGDAGVRVAGPEVDGRSGIKLAVNPINRSFAITASRSSVGLFALTAPEPSPAPIVPSQILGCQVMRDIALVIDGSPGMQDAYPSLRTAIDAMLSKPRSAAINLAALTTGRRSAQVFAPLTVPAVGLAGGRDIGTLRSLLVENVSSATGAADYAAGIAAAQAARPDASAIVLITDARQPPPAGLPLPAGTRLYVLQLGGGPGARAGRPPGRVRRPLRRAVLPRSRRRDPAGRARARGGRPHVRGRAEHESEGRGRRVGRADEHRRDAVAVSPPGGVQDRAARADADGDAHAELRGGPARGSRALRGREPRDRRRPARREAGPRNRPSEREPGAARARGAPGHVREGPAADGALRAQRLSRPRGERARAPCRRAGRRGRELPGGSIGGRIKLRKPPKRRDVGITATGSIKGGRRR